MPDSPCLNIFVSSVLIVLFGCLFAITADAEPRHGIAMHGEPAYAADFAHFSYAESNAPKGGTVTLAVLGTFDSTNPLIISGVPASRCTGACVREPDGAGAG